MSERLKIGDAIQSFKVTRDRTMIPENWTIIEIHPTPETNEEQTEFIGGIIRRYHDELQRYGVTVISGKNLADKSQYTDRVDMTALYVVETPFINK